MKVFLESISTISKRSAGFLILMLLSAAIALGQAQSAAADLSGVVDPNGLSSRRRGECAKPCNQHYPYDERDSDGSYRFKPCRLANMK